jgi:hypothetical protein
VSDSVPAAAQPSAPTPTPRRVLLPLGGEASCFTREHLTILYRCSHGELGRLLVRKQAPLPIRIDGQILWYCDEVVNSQAQVIRTLERWRKR